MSTGTDVNVQNRSTVTNFLMNKVVCFTFVSVFLKYHCVSVPSGWITETPAF